MREPLKIENLEIKKSVKINITNDWMEENEMKNIVDFVCEFLARFIFSLIISFITLQHAIDYFPLRYSMRFLLALIILLGCFSIFLLLGCKDIDIGKKIFRFLGNFSILLFVLMIFILVYLNFARVPRFEALLYEGAARYYWLLGTEGKKVRLYNLEQSIKNNPDRSDNIRLFCAELILEEKDIELMKKGREYCDIVINNELKNNVDTNSNYSNKFYKAHAIKGKLLYFLGYDVEEYINFFSKAYEHGICDYDTTFYYALANYKIGNWKLSVKLYKTLFSDCNSDYLGIENKAEAYYWYAEALYNQNQEYTDEILSYLNKAISSCRTNPSYYETRANCYLELWDDSCIDSFDYIKAAIDDFSIVINQGRKSYSIYQWRAYAYMLYGENIANSVLAKYYKLALNDLNTGLKYNTAPDASETKWALYAREKISDYLQIDMKDSY